MNCSLKDNQNNDGLIVLDVIENRRGKEFVVVEVEQFIHDFDSEMMSKHGFKNCPETCNVRGEVGLCIFSVVGYDLHSFNGEIASPFKYCLELMWSGHVKGSVE